MYGFVILWRYDQNKIRFAWLNEQWLTKEIINESGLQLELETYIRGTAKLDYHATLKPLVFVFFFHL